MNRIVSTFLFILSGLPIFCQESLSEAHELTERLVKEIEARKDIVGVSISIGVVDSVVFSRGYGFVNREDSVRTKPYHKFRIYSLSKHITAIAAAKLVEQGLLDLQAPIGNYIPFLDTRLHAITSQQLIAHTSGIRSYHEGEWQIVSNASCISPFESILSFQSDSLLFQPGENFNYTSFGYVLLSAVVEKVAEKPFIEYLQDELFQPSGNLNINLDEAKKIDHLAAKPYEYWQGVMYQARFANNSCKFGGGGLSASTSDLVKFNLALLNGSLLNDASISKIFSSHQLNNGEITNYGFGLEFAKDEKGQQYAFHSGRSRGGRNALIIYPDIKLIVCLSANTNGDSLVDAALTIAGFYKEHLN